MARCELPAAHQCLWEHVRHKTKAAGLKPKETKDQQTGRPGLSLLCPNHADTKHSLSISVAEFECKWLVWYCHAGCPEPAIRLALIEVAHIDPRCLPVSQEEAAQILDAVIGELSRPRRDHAQKLLTAMSVALGYKELPRGGPLERLAARVGVNRRSAYNARKRGVQRDNP